MGQSNRLKAYGKQCLAFASHTLGFHLGFSFKGKNVLLSNYRFKRCQSSKYLKDWRLGRLGSISSLHVDTADSQYSCYCDLHCYRDPMYVTSSLRTSVFLKSKMVKICPALTCLSGLAEGWLYVKGLEMWFQQGIFVAILRKN